MAAEKEKPLTRKDVVKLIEKNGGTARGLDLSQKQFEEGINLSNLDLSGIDLSKARLFRANFDGSNLDGAIIQAAYLGYATFNPSDSKVASLQGVDFRMANLHNAEFKKANVSGAQFQGVPVPGTQISERSWLIWPASLENTDFRGANLFRADFRGCYFYGTKLEGAYIRGADITIDTHLGDADWGNYVIGEEKNKEFYFAEHRYRHLKMWYTHAGYYGIAAKFYYREKEASRKSLRWYSRHRLALEFLRALFGYGEGWKRVLVSIAVLILLFALTYCAIGSAWEWSAFGNSLYFSAVSFTALGYGSWVQATNGWMKGIGAFESLVGVSMMALLLVTFFRKWTR